MGDIEEEVQLMSAPALAWGCSATREFDSEDELEAISVDTTYFYVVPDFGFNSIK